MVIRSNWACSKLAIKLPFTGCRFVAVYKNLLIHYTIDGNCLKISGIGPYMLVNGEVLQHQLWSIVNLIMDRHSASHIKITVPPSIYMEKADEEMLLEYGKAKLLFNDPHYVIEVSDTSFTAMLPGDQKRIFKRGVSLFTSSYSQVLLKNDEYDLIYQSRISRFNPPPPSLPLLLQQYKTCPSLFNKWTAFKNSELVGCIWAFKASEKTIQVAYMATSVDGKSPSANIFLIGKIYEWAMANNVNYIDLGTASIQGTVINGLAEFKKSLNAQPYDKPTYEFHRRISVL